jgi:hypothetical protein
MGERIRTWREMVDEEIDNDRFRMNENVAPITRYWLIATLYKLAVWALIAYVAIVYWDFKR